MKKSKRPTTPSSNGSPVVHYNEELLELQVDGVTIRRFDARAINLIAILIEFEREEWRKRVVCTLKNGDSTDPRALLRKTISRLNEHQTPYCIHFFSDGKGTGIRWEFIPPSAEK